MPTKTRTTPQNGGCGDANRTEGSNDKAISERISAQLNVSGED